MVGGSKASVGKEVVLIFVLLAKIPPIAIPKNNKGCSVKKSEDGIAFLN